MSIYDKLYSWQKSIIDKYAYKESFGLFLEMGLGKTPLSLAFAERNNCDKLLIITVNTKAIEKEDVEGSWLSWVKNSSIKYICHNKLSHVKFSTSDPELLLINYESLFSRKKDRRNAVVLSDTIKEFLKSCKGHNVGIIVDESHKMKNLNSLQTKAILMIKKEALNLASKVYTYLLSGTPFTVGYLDLYAQLKMLGYAETKGTFIDNYCVRGNVPGLLGWQQPVIGYKNVDDLFNLIHQYGITIKSKEVIDLPEKIITYHIMPKIHEFDLFTNMRLQGKIIAQELQKKHLEDNPEVNIKLYYNKETNINNPFFRCIDYPNQDWLADTNGTFWLRARELSIGFQGSGDNYKWFDGSRLEALKKFLKENPENYVIFYNYTPELYEIFHICETLGYNIDIYCGELKSLYNYEKYQNMNEEEKMNQHKNVIIANYVSGATGMNWQEYNHCILFSIPLYKDYEQSIKRLHRIGQKNTVFYEMFYQDNWLDNSMLKSLEEGKDYSLKMFESDLGRVQQLIHPPIAQ